MIMTDAYFNYSIHHRWIQHLPGSVKIILSSQHDVIGNYITVAKKILLLVKEYTLQTNLKCMTHSHYTECAIVRFPISNFHHQQPRIIICRYIHANPVKVKDTCRYVCSGLDIINTPYSLLFTIMHQILLL